MKNNICTIVSNNYLAQAITLFKSVKKYNPNLDFSILIVDKKNKFDNKYKEDGLFIYNVNELNIKNIKKMAFKYNVTEFNTSVKPHFIEFLYENKGYNSVTYIDPDMMIFNKLDKIIELLDNYSIILTPHICNDMYNKGTLVDSDFLKNGIYNLGFISTKNDDNTKRMLKWWKERLENEGYADATKGLAWDQKWMDFCPALFNGVYILKDPGYNFAHWNMHERKISEINGIKKVNNEFDLVLFHFSQFKFNNPAYILLEKDYLVNDAKCIKVNDREDLKDVYEYYYKEVMNNGYEMFSKYKYSYNYFENGKEILKIHRVLYEDIERKIDIYKDPFKVEAENSYYNWLKKERYIDKVVVNKISSNNELSTSNSQINIVFKGLKIFRTILGVKKYINLMKKISWTANISNHSKIYNKVI